MSLHPYMLLTFLVLASMPASATSRMGHAAVVTEAGLPCFKIADEEERKRGRTSLKMLIISEKSTEGWQDIWSVRFPNASFGDPDYRLPKNACIRYGHAPAGVDASDATPLRQNTIYSVFFMGRPPSASDPTSRYGTQFCVLATATDGLLAVQLTHDTSTSMDPDCARHATPK